MAEDRPDDEKTEAPTQRRREQAREKGDRLASRDLATGLAGLAGALWLWIFADGLGQAFRTLMARALVAAGGAANTPPARLLVDLLMPLGWPLAALALVIVAAAVAGQGLTGGLGFTPALLAPRAGRLDPLKGLGRMFGKRGLVELLKALAKAAILLGVSAVMLHASLPALAGLPRAPLGDALLKLTALGLKLMLWLTLGLAVIAGGDLPIQIIDWLKRLRMTKQDVKDEMKQQEGAADVKYAIRRMARENLRRANRQAIAEASVVLTNPTHFAVALRYRPETDAAPVIVARGRGVVAGVIRELAAEHGVPILSYPSVARALYFTGRVGASIRPELFGPVATILAWVMRTGALSAPAPEAEAPPQARFDEKGRRIGASG
ncbi:EscU/YscU/HrcU family type III secretion system export apparatus switch protein [Sandaracinobacteroides sp. A072]|uniref:EscU/YscU/HrcU family type III secretion system export apparatus switch protein n=1 Tax=Sandaracinobacteroides sp. A072 TaxID=3461146 RepID=UPI004042806A